MAGHLGKAFWFSDQTGGFVSSTYYYPENKLPDWVERGNSKIDARKYQGPRCSGRSDWPRPGGVSGPVSGPLLVVVVGIVGIVGMLCAKLLAATGWSIHLAPTSPAAVDELPMGTLLSLFLNSTERFELTEVLPTDSGRVKPGA